MRLLIAAVLLVLSAALPVSGCRGYAAWETVAWIPFASPPVRVRDIVLNVILYVPLGAAIVRSGIWRRPLIPALSLALLLSVFTEFVQLYSLKRFPAMQDVVCNVAGAAAGALLVSLVNRDSPEDTL